MFRTTVFSFLITHCIADRRNNASLPSREQIILPLFGKEKKISVSRIQRSGLSLKFTFFTHKMLEKKCLLIIHNIQE